MPAAHALSGKDSGGAGYTGLAVVVGDVLRANYQPASHFWRVQWIEGGGLLALSALLIAVTVGLVHRRAA